MKEAKIAAFLKKRLKGEGAVVIRILVAGERGIPDYVVVHKGRTYFVETKSTEGRLSPAQVLQHARIRAAGGEVIVCASCTSCT